MELQNIIDQITQLSQQDDLIQLGRAASEIRQIFEDQLLELERQEQIKRLEEIEKGSSYELTDFSPFKEAFYEVYNQFVSKRKSQLQLQQSLEAQNLKLKKELIDRLKEVVDNEEKIGSAFQAYKEIHESWKKIGAIARDQREAIQKEYSRLLEIFFYNINIYKELKDHDYRRNKQLKEDLIFRLKQLRIANITQRELEDQLRGLQDEWEEIGPVQNDDWEIMKGAYWEAVRAIYDKINAFYEAQRQQLKANIEEKKKIVAALAQRMSEVSQWETNKQWETQTAYVLALQAQWKTIGFGSRKENQNVYEEFRAQCDTFFSAKKQFSAAQDADNKVIVVKKKGLIEKAVSLSSSTDWKQTATQYKKLQKDWQALGSAGQRYDNKLWKEFRAACDSFFTARQSYFESLDAENAQNLVVKQNLIKTLNDYKLPKEKEVALDELKEFQKQFTAIGPVGIKEGQAIYNAFKSRMDELYNALKLEGQEKERVLFAAKVEQMLASPNRQKLLQTERQELRKQIDQLQREILTLENNLGFFARSKGADSLRQEVNKKIDTANNKIKGLKTKLRLIPNE